MTVRFTGIWAIVAYVAWWAFCLYLIYLGTDQSRPNSWAAAVGGGIGVGKLLATFPRRGDTP